MFVTMEFTRGKWIGPALEFNWPEDRTTPLYWEAGTDFELPGRPESVRLAVAADRHYEVFVNGHRAGRRRNFYNGDEYVFAQTWSDEVRALLRPGRNRLEVVVRSDPWRNKNHRCFRPALALEAELVCGSKTIALGSDSSWELGVIEGWRSLRALAGIGTIHFETVSVPAVGEAMLAGFSNRMVRRVDTAAIDPPKRVFAWDDPP